MSITSEWTKGKIGDICIVGDGAHAKVERQISGVMYLTSKNLKDGRLDISQVTYISETDFNKHFRDESKALTKIKPNDVIFGIIGTIGEPYIVNSRDRFGISSSVAILRPNKSVIFPKYLFYWIENRIFQDALYAIKGGVAQGYVSLEMIRSLPLYYPLLSIQKKIASILSSYDNLIENNTRRIEILEQMAKLIYEEWFVKFRFPGHGNVKMGPSELGEIPERWKVSKIGDIFTVILGGTPSRKREDYWNGNIPWINSGKVNELRIINESEGITELGLKKSATKMMPVRTTVLAITGATLGQISLTEIEVCANQSVVGIYDEKKIYSESIFLKINEIIDEVILKAGGGAQQHINKEIVNETEVTIPPANLIGEFNSIIKPIFNQISILLFKNQNLHKTRDLLLPKLISGEIDVSDLDIHIRNELLES